MRYKCPELDDDIIDGDGYWVGHVYTVFGYDEKNVSWLIDVDEADQQNYLYVVIHSGDNSWAVLSSIEVTENNKHEKVALWLNGG